MDAVARTLLRRVHHIREKRQRHRRSGPLGLQQLVLAALHIRQTINVQLEHLRRVLGADTVPRTEILIDPDLQRLTLDPGRLLHAHLSLPLTTSSRTGIRPALTGVERFEPTCGGFPIMFGGYSPGVRESARVKIGHTSTVFVI